MSDPNRNLAWAGVLVEELVRSGVRSAILSPGSRSAPLALAFAAHPDVRDRVILDERSAAFFALGLARATRSPVALVCTSGTAAANYLPAVVEAHHDRIPLVVLSADRPAELRDCGAGQTIDQLRLYGSFARFFRDLPSPEPDETHFRHLRASACRAVAEAMGRPPGPVHLNLPFRDPLAPVEVEGDRRALEELSPLARHGRTRAPVTRARPAQALVPAEVDVARLARRIAAEPRGWIVAGPLDAEVELVHALTGLARAAGWPLFGEPLAQLRSGTHDRSLLVDAHDAVLCAERFVASHLPGIVLRFGAATTSKRLREIPGAHPEIAGIVIDPDGWSDPGGLSCEMVRADPLPTARALVHHLESMGIRRDPDFAREWVAAGATARRVLDAELRARATLTEPGIVGVLAEMLPEGATLFTASSMPVRDVDTFWPAGDRAVRVLANRGANGIDGTLASALGAALGSGTPFAALIGDLALLHDWSSVLPARAPDIDATIVVVDNDGGGIFGFLPVASSVPPESFERHFSTPQRVDLRAALGGFGLPCRDATSPAELREALRTSLASPGVQFVRVPSDRAENVELHRKLLHAVAAALGSASPGA